MSVAPSGPVSAAVPSVDLFSMMGISLVFPPDGDPASPAEEINSITFSDSGKYCAFARNSGMIELINTETGRIENRYKTPDGACCLTFTHDEQSVLFAGTSPESKSVVMYYSLYDNTRMREFRFHTDRITSVTMCPSSDVFVTTSADNTFAVWDVRRPEPIRKGRALVNGTMVGSFDASGMVMGIASPSGHVMLYDPTSEAQDPFSKRHVDCLGMEQKGIDWSDMQFSDDDQYLALACTLGVVLLDAIDLGEVTLLRKHEFSHTKHCNVKFSVDGEFLFTGGSDGFVYYYNLHRTPEMRESKTTRFDPPVLKMGSALKTPAQPSDAGLKHNGPISAVAWHPSLAMFASGCSTLCLWTPAPPV